MKPVTVHLLAALFNCLVLATGFAAHLPMSRGLGNVALLAYSLALLPIMCEAEERAAGAHK